MSMKQQSEINNLKRENETLYEEINRLVGRVDVLEEEIDKLREKRGRPKKDG